jgi:hypothetical protein
MPAIARSRLDEMRSTAAEVIDAMRLGGGGSLVDKLAILATAVTEVNRSLADVDEMLLAGLKDEALSMHDPELGTVARLLDLRAHPEWVRLHGWLLERGQVPPASVNLAAAEDFVKVREEIDALRDDRGRLRRLALERAPLKARIEMLRGLRAADPASRAWVEAIATHEEARIRELRLQVPQAMKARDIESLAMYAEELADLGWERAVPADLVALTAGAEEAGHLLTIAAEAESIANELTKAMSGAGPASPREVDAVDARRMRLLELGETSTDHSLALLAHPAVNTIVQARGIDAAVRSAMERAAGPIAAIEQLAATLKTRRDFEAACGRLEYLCDHPPATGAEAIWLTDLQRNDSLARACCQEIHELTMPMLLQERVQRAAVAIESREQLRRRFRVVLAVAGTAALAVIAIVVGLIVWRRSEYACTIAEIERRAAEAAAGFHLHRPSDLDRSAGVYDDARVAALLENFEAGVAAEIRRTREFKEALADLGEAQESLAADVAERTSATEDVWIEAWPRSYVDAAVTLAEARSRGGLPKHREAAPSDRAKESTSDHVEASTMPPDARSRFQEEEDRLARAEARQADYARTLAELAEKAFERRLTLIQQRIDDIADGEAEDIRAILDDARALLATATAPKADGLPREAGGPRVAAGSTASLEAVIKRLKSHRRREDSP